MKKTLITFVLLLAFIMIFTGCLAMPNTSFYGNNVSGAYSRFIPLLNFNGEDSYRILQLTDIQFVDSYISDKSKAVMDKLIDNSEPNLIIITGDLVSSEMLVNNTESGKAINDDIVAYFEEKQIAWTIVFGNHDGLMQDVNGVAWKEYLYNECYKNAVYFVGGADSLSQKTVDSERIKQSEDVCEVYFGDDNAEVSDQFFNFSIYIKNGDDLVFTLMGLDTGTLGGASANGGSYIELTQKQADFYENSCILKSDGTKAEKGEEAVPTLLFTHQPLNMYNTAYLNRYNSSKVENFAGEILDSKTSTAPNGICSPFIDYEIFESVMLERKNIAGVFVGHDHLNTFTAIYKPSEDYKVMLSYGRISSYGLPFYPGNDFIRGGRVIDLKNDGTFSTSDVLCELISSENGYEFGYFEKDIIKY